MSLLTRMRTVAERLLNSSNSGYGEAITLTKTTLGAYDPTTSTVSTSSSTTYTGYGHASMYDERFVDGNTIQMGDLEVIVHNLDGVPDAGDTLTINSTDYTVVSSKSIRVQGGNVAFKMQVRTV